MKRVIVSQMSRDKALGVLSKYSEEELDFFRECKAEMDSVESYTLDDDNKVVDYPVDDDIEEIRELYLTPALHEGVVRSAREFDLAIEALDVLE